MRSAPLRSCFAIAPLLLAACAAPSAPEPSKDPTPPAAVAAAPEKAPAQAAELAAKRHFGGEITEASTTALDALVSAPAKFAEKTVRTEGVVSAVCQKMGCWMEIADSAGSAHIRMAGHRFFVPRDAKGHHAIVQGRLLRGQSDTCGADGCRAEAASAELAKVELEATAVELVD